MSTAKAPAAPSDQNCEKSCHSKRPTPKSSDLGGDWIYPSGCPAYPLPCTDIAPVATPPPPVYRSVKQQHETSITECGIIRLTNAIYMGSHSLLGSKLSGVPKY